MKVSYRTHNGLVRVNNEDAYLIHEPYLFAVADGVGGCNAGEVASRQGLDAFAREVVKGIESAEEPELLLRRAVSGANEKLYSMAMHQGEYRGMATTLTGVLLVEGQLYLVQIGDSRLYRWRQGLLTQLSVDQSVQNVLLQALGSETIVKPQITVFAVEMGDRYLLCTDGLTRMVPDAGLAEFLRETDTDKCAEGLLQGALQAGGNDNVTIVVLDIVEEG